MALQFKITTSTISDLTLHMPLRQQAGPEQMEQRQTFFPAEWFPQSGVQLTWPHSATDWAPILKEAEDCFTRILLEILVRGELALIVTPEPDHVRSLVAERIPSKYHAQVICFQCPTNDTWARDHGFLTLITETGPQLLDFCFNGWGEKFPAELDNLINQRLCPSPMESDANENSPLHGMYVSHLDFVFEGGSIESDGAGTLLTTSECLLSPHRNPSLTQQQIEERLLHWFHAQRVLWLDHGYLAGDDTDSHIDTLARFCNASTIAYVQCTDSKDEHYEELKAMEAQLGTFRTLDGKPYRLIPLPLPAPVFDPEDGHRLPATYANFLIINKAVLMPTYKQPDLDEQAISQLQKAFPRHEIVPIDCSILIRQHGSLHCSTMQFPMNVLVN